LLKFIINKWKWYKIKLILIASDIDRLDLQYGKNMVNSIINDCFYKIFYTPKNLYSISRILENFPLSKDWAEAIKQLPIDSQIIVKDFVDPLICKKFYYYNDEIMKKAIG
jgi:type IV secretory pathway TraG/TraD family ATPase VirD4